MEYSYKNPKTTILSFINNNNTNYQLLNIKYLLLFFIILGINIYLIFININNKLINHNYLEIQNQYNISFNNKIKNKINLAIFAFGIKNGGRARITSLLINYFINIKIFNIYLFTRRLKEEDEYKIPDNIKRILINNNLINKIK